MTFKVNLFMFSFYISLKSRKNSQCHFNKNKWQTQMHFSVIWWFMSCISNFFLYLNILMRMKGFAWSNIERNFQILDNLPFDWLLIIMIQILLKSITSKTKFEGQGWQHLARLVTGDCFMIPVIISWYFTTSWFWLSDTVSLSVCLYHW